MIDVNKFRVDLGNPELSDRALRIMQELISTRSTAALRDTELDERADEEHERWDEWRILGRELAREAQLNPPSDKQIRDAQRKNAELGF